MIAWLIASFAVLTLLRMPIAFAMAIAAMLAIWLGDGRIPLLVVPQRLIAGVDSFPLLAVPLFILAGELMGAGGITQRIVGTARAIVGHITGGLGHVTVVSEIVLSGISGSATGDAAAIGSVMVPSMAKAGYDRPFTAALVGAAATIGPIIPPSILMVLYGVAAEVSIGRLFVGGVIPGVLMGGGLMAIVYYLSRKRSYPRERRASLSLLMASVRSSFWALLMPVIVLGGMLGGVFTATEAAAIAVAYAFVIGLFVYREIRVRDLPRVFTNSMVDSGVVMIIVGAASATAWILARERAPQMVAQFFFSMSDSPTIVLFMINVLFLLLGMVMESAAILLLSVPVILPVVKQLGVDPVHFGVVATLNLAIGTITPPLGLVMYVMCRIGRVSMGDFARASLPFLAVLILVLGLITYVPATVLWLPNLVFGNQ